jgi:hypothetical protein
MHARRRSGATVRWPWWVEVAVVALFYEAYELFRAIDPTRPVPAFRHAAGLFGLERAVHLDIESAVNQVMAHHEWLADASGYYYAVVHPVLTVAVLFWLFFRRPAIYQHWRNTLIGASAAALLVFWLFPVAPPRLAQPGMTDILVAHDIFGVAHAAHSGGFVNVYAAVPSLHVGWAVWAALAMNDALGDRPWRHVVWLYPLTTTLVVLGTANHYVIDAVAGAVLVLVTSAVLTRLPGARCRR